MNVIRTTFQSRIWQRFTVALAAALLAFGVTSVVATPPTSASADACSFFGTGIKGAIRNGQFCAGIEGEGTYIRTVHANFGMTIPGRDVLCNPSIKLDVFDRWDHWVTARQGEQLSGCAWGAFNFPKGIDVWWDFPQADGGKLYVTLQSSGTSVAVNQFDFHS